MHKYDFAAIHTNCVVIVVVAAALYQRYATIHQMPRTLCCTIRCSRQA
jgi:hypothetical protein